MNMNYNNVSILIRNREYLNNKKYKYNQKVLRLLITQKNDNFKSYFEIITKTAISIEKFIVLTENFQKGYDLNSPASPYMCFDKKNTIVNSYGYIEDSISSHCLQEFQYNEDKEFKRIPYTSFALTSKNYLIHINVETGQILFDLYLSKVFKFKAITWDVSEESFVLISTRNIHRQLNNNINNQDAFMAIFLFNVWPIKFVGAMTITLQIFGSRISDVIVSNNMLVVSHNDSIIKLYSMNHILTKNFPDHNWKNGCNMSIEQLKLVNKIPFNIIFEEEPPVIFEVKAPQCYFNIGGIPWLYITFVDKLNVAQYSVNSLAEKTKIDKPLGSLDIKLEADKCYFHPDESGKIILIGNSSIKVYKIKEKLSKVKVEKQIFTLEQIQVLTGEIKSISEIFNEKPNEFSLSGRKLKRIFNPNSLHGDFYNIIQCLTYEDELDILVVASIVQNKNNMGLVCFYDNQTGKLLSYLELSSNWDIDSEHTVELDQDILYHSFKSKGAHYLRIYRLKRDDFVK